MKPVGVVHKKEKTAWIEISPKYVKGLKGLEDYSHVWIIWWLDRNDTPRERSILQVHPKGNPRNPMTGVFATRSPVRPNLIAMSLCEIESIKKNKIEIGRIDAFDCTPVMDIKPYIPAVDKVEQVKLPAWLKGSG
jgi:tRNA-Thr(GGU) m(6)t(6)A37 methyltransferase TsaA